MPKFRKKVAIEAVQFLMPASVSQMLAFDDWMVANQGNRKCRYRGAELIIPTLEGDHIASSGDWIIRGIKGELYPCKPDIFAATYEAVEG